MQKKKTKKKERKMVNLAFQAVVGSHNYNLVTPTSDKDKKAFFFPNFYILYKGFQPASKAITGETEDIEYHDIRKLTHLLFKSNVNFLEVLFSVEVNTYHPVYGKLSYHLSLDFLYRSVLGMKAT
nr:nucleotidyltransferase domain-containing protein [Neobacillus paridis]